jgi:hypothetical protein
LPNYSVIPDNPEFFSFRKMILYWGDFLHMYQYHQNVARYLYNLQYFRTFEDAINRVYSVLLLKDQQREVLSTKITFGSTLLFNSMSDETDPEYGFLLKKFLEYGNSWFRDVFSAIKASHITGDYFNSFLGIDCATLVTSSMIVPGQSNPYKKKSIGIFIGRTADHFKEVLQFAEDFSKSCGIPLKWISWGDTKAFPTLKNFETESLNSHLDGIDFTGIRDPLQALAQLLEFDLIISDTYHICVNAWNLNIPAICFAGDDQYKLRNVNSGNFFSRLDKRFVFYGMYGALDFLVPYHELMSNEFRDLRLHHLLKILDKGEIVPYIHQRIAQHSKYSEAILTEAIFTLINR